MENILFIVNIVLVALLSPAIVGTMRKIRVRIQGGEHQSLLQPYHDILRSFRHEMMVSGNSSWVSAISPYIVFTITLALAAGVPLFMINTYAAISDFTVFIYLLCAATFFAALSTLDSSEKFGFQAFSTSILSKVALVFPLTTIALMTGSANLSSMTYQLLSLRIVGSIPFMLSGIAFFLILCIETNISEPDSEDSKRDPLIVWALACKTLLLMLLFVDIFIPVNIATTFSPQDLFSSIIACTAKIVALAVILEIVRSKIFLFKASHMLALSYILGIIALSLV